MIYELEKCPVCGSIKLKQKSILNNGDDTIIKYQCLSCDSIVSNNSYLNTNKTDGTKIFNDAMHSVIELTADFGNLSTSGTGMLLEDNYVLTNAHIVSIDSEFADTISGNYCNGLNNYNLEIISIDEDLDIALLRIESLNYKPIKLEDVCVHTGEKVYAIGNAIGQGLSIVEGIISDANREVNGMTYIMHSAPVNHGNSGGPLYNSKGQVIGMISSSRKDAKNMSYAVTNSILIEFLNGIINTTQ